jgi:hypothetical protein
MTIENTSFWRVNTCVNKLHNSQTLSILFIQARITINTKA